jgi:hypothetical protein
MFPFRRNVQRQAPQLQAMAASHRRRNGGMQACNPIPGFRDLLRPSFSHLPWPSGTTPRKPRRSPKFAGSASVIAATTNLGWPSPSVSNNVNRDVAESVRTAIEKRYGADLMFLLDPATPDADLPKGSGADHMLMWTTVLEGVDGFGDFDFAYFTGSQDFARYFGFDGVADMAKQEQYFGNCSKSGADSEMAVQNGPTKAAFPRYYALRASVRVSRGAHDEWNILRLLDERRRAAGKSGTGNQISIPFDGHGLAPAIPSPASLRVTWENARCNEPSARPPEGGLAPA